MRVGGGFFMLFFFLGGGGDNRVFSTGGRSRCPYPTGQKFTHFSSKGHLPSPQLSKNFHVITQQKLHFFSCSLCSCTIFILPSYFLYTQVMLILILINVQYLQNVVFSFGKGLSGKNHSLSDSHHPVEKSPPDKFTIFRLLSYCLENLGQRAKFVKVCTLYYYLHNPGQRAKFVKVCLLIPSEIKTFLYTIFFSGYYHDIKNALPYGAVHMEASWPGQAGQLAKVR